MLHPLFSYCRCPSYLHRSHLSRARGRGHAHAHAHIASYRVAIFGVFMHASPPTSQRKNEMQRRPALKIVVCCCLLIGPVSCVWISLIFLPVRFSLACPNAAFSKGIASHTSAFPHK